MTEVKTLADLARPAAAGRAMLIRDASLILGGSLLVALCARIQAPTWPVPITLQPFAVLLVAAALGSRRGALAMIAYLAQGAAGLPVFAMPPYSGPLYLAGPTAGFLVGFVPAAYFVGLLAQRGWDRRFHTAAAAMALGQLIILGFGFGWLATGFGLAGAFEAAVAPFLLGDVLKILLAAAALPIAWRLLHGLDVSNR